MNNTRCWWRQECAVNKLNIHADRGSRVNILKAWQSVQLQGLEMKSQHSSKCRRGLEAMMAIVTMKQFNFTWTNEVEMVQNMVRRIENSGAHRERPGKETGTHQKWQECYKKELKEKGGPSSFQIPATKEKRTENGLLCLVISDNRKTSFCRAVVLS